MIALPWRNCSVPERENAAGRARGIRDGAAIAAAADPEDPDFRQVDGGRGELLVARLRPLEFRLQIGRPLAVQRGGPDLLGPALGVDFY